MDNINFQSICADMLLDPNFVSASDSSDDIADTIQNVCGFQEPFSIINMHCDKLEDSVDGYHEACGWKPAPDQFDKNFSTFADLEPVVDLFDFPQYSDTDLSLSFPSNVSGEWMIDNLFIWIEGQKKFFDSLSAYEKNVLIDVWDSFDTYFQPLISQKITFCKDENFRRMEIVNTFLNIFARAPKSPELYLFSDFAPKTNSFSDHISKEFIRGSLVYRYVAGSDSQRKDVVQLHIPAGTPTLFIGLIKPYDQWEILLPPGELQAVGFTVDDVYEDWDSGNKNSIPKDFLCFNYSNPVTNFDYLFTVIQPTITAINYLLKKLSELWLVKKNWVLTGLSGLHHMLHEIYNVELPKFSNIKYVFRVYNNMDPRLSASEIYTRINAIGQEVMNKLEEWKKEYMSSVTNPVKFGVEINKDLDTHGFGTVYIRIGFKICGRGITDVVLIELVNNNTLNPSDLFTDKPSFLPFFKVEKYLRDFLNYDISDLSTMRTIIDMKTACYVANLAPISMLDYPNKNHQLCNFAKTANLREVPEKRIREEIENIKAGGPLRRQFFYDMFLKLAVKTKNEKMLEYLLNKGAKPDYRDINTYITDFRFDDNLFIRLIREGNLYKTDFMKLSLSQKQNLKKQIERLGLVLPCEKKPLLYNRDVTEDDVKNSTFEMKDPLRYQKYDEALQSPYIGKWMDVAAEDWLKSYLDGTFMGKIYSEIDLSQDIIDNLGQFKDSGEILLFRGIHFNIMDFDQLDEFCLNPLDRNHLYKNTTLLPQSWTWNYRMAENFAKLGSFNFVIARWFKPEEILINTTLWEDYKSARNFVDWNDPDSPFTLQDEVIVKPGIYWCKILPQPVPFDKSYLLTPENFDALKDFHSFLIKSREDCGSKFTKFNTITYDKASYSRRIGGLFGEYIFEKTLASSLTSFKVVFYYDIDRSKKNPKKIALRYGWQSMSKEGLEDFRKFMGSLAGNDLNTTEYFVNFNDQECIDLGCDEHYIDRWKIVQYPNREEFDDLQSAVTKLKRLINEMCKYI